MSSSAQRDAACVIGRTCGDDLLLSAPVRRNLTARQQRAAIEYIELHRLASSPPPMAFVNLDRPKVDSSRRSYEPCITDDVRRFRELVAALPNPATRRVLADVLDGVGLTEAGRRLARAHRAAWMPTASNESDCIMVVKVLLATGLDCIANALGLPP